MNFYFKKNKLNGSAVHISLFELEKVKKIISEKENPRIIFLFKTIDALESLKDNYSKDLILETIQFADKYVVSFPTKSLGNKQKFRAKRNWIINFINENFKILDNFEFGGERYILFSK
ncbi:Uncharacterised protein [uncultured archaeon]|nr:Uncharacterised protein [uncultured archaeon]